MVALVIFIVLLIAGIWLLGTLTTNVLGLLFTIIVTAIVGSLADLVVPGRLPFGWLGAIAAGLFGSWLGVLLLGQIGPVIAGIPILPAFIGAVILAFVASLIIKGTAGRTTV